jgi:hypothetical protein
MRQHSDDFWYHQLPAATRCACETPDGRRIAFRVMSKAFGRTERCSAHAVLSWIACVERELAREGRS